MGKITPTVGRVVWYWRSPKAEQKQPFAASVSYVHDDRTVNLSYVTHEGMQAARKRVTLVQPGDDEPTADFCEWMPYQIGQARSTAT